jgi:hypothetical protein
MSFDLQRYLIENNLTLIGKIRVFEDVDDDTEEPSDKEVKDSSKDIKDLDKQKKELKQLQTRAKDIIFKYTEDTPQGRKVKGSITAYQKAIGDLPKKIKALKAKIDAIEKPSSNQEED